MFNAIKKFIFGNPETSNFGEQGVWFDEESEGYDAVVTDRNVTTVSEARQWVDENYNAPNAAVEIRK